MTSQQEHLRTSSVTSRYLSKWTYESVGQELVVSESLFGGVLILGHVRLNQVGQQSSFQRRSISPSDPVSGEGDNLQHMVTESWEGLSSLVDNMSEWDGNVFGQGEQPVGGEDLWYEVVDGGGDGWAEGDLVVASNVFWNRMILP